VWASISLPRGRRATAWLRVAFLGGFTQFRFIAGGLPLPNAEDCYELQQPGPRPIPFVIPNRPARQGFEGCASGSFSFGDGLVRSTGDVEPWCVRLFFCCHFVNPPFVSFRRCAESDHLAAPDPIVGGSFTGGSDELEESRLAARLAGEKTRRSDSKRV